jgi:hypothetical protein
MNKTVAKLLSDLAPISVALLTVLPIVVLVKPARRLGLIGGRARDAPAAAASP